MTRRDLVVGPWGARFCGRFLPCAVGRGGVGVKRGEGDGVTPAGARRLIGGCWRADRMRRPQTVLPLFAAGPRDRWSDDPNDPAYNGRVSGRNRPFSAEFLARADPLYDLALFTDFNAAPRIAGAGSAIFLHVWRGPRRPTEGCVAFAPPDLIWIAARWSPRSRLIVQS